MKTTFFFENHPIFRYQEFADFMIQRGITNPSSWRQQLQYHCKQDHIKRIRRLLYAVKKSSSSIMGIDPYMIASKTNQDAVLAYHTALELHGLAYTTFEELIYLTKQASKPFNYEGQIFRPIIFPASLRKKNKIEFGVDEITRSSLTIKITSLERTIVDVLDRPDLAGGWEELWRSLEHVVHFNAQKLVDYALLLDNATTIAKIGFFLEQRPPYLAMPVTIIKQLLTRTPTQPHYFDRSQRKEGVLIKKWHLIVPKEILEKKWEEPKVAT